jgi:hypothetical protein
LLEASVATVKCLPERALRDKQAHARLLAVVGQYDKFAAKEQRKVLKLPRSAQRTRARARNARMSQPRSASLSRHS